MIVEGELKKARVKSPSRLAITHDDRLLIYDEDRILEIATLEENPKLVRLIGGGSDSNDQVQDPLQVKFEKFTHLGWVK